jgi:O-acetylhomoserine (thiol)-lyase
VALTLIKHLHALLSLQGLKTVTLRIRQYSENTFEIKVAEWQKIQPKVGHMIYCDTHTGEIRRRADKMVKGGCGGLVKFWDSSWREDSTRARG